MRLLPRAACRHLYLSNFEFPKVFKFLGQVSAGACENYGTLGVVGKNALCTGIENSAADFPKKPHRQQSHEHAAWAAPRR